MTRSYTLAAALAALLLVSGASPQRVISGADGSHTALHNWAGVDARSLLQGTNTSSVVGAAQADPTLSTTVRAIQTANLTNALSNSSVVATVFAPNNDAWTKATVNLNATLDDIFNSTLLVPILLYHVIPNRALAAADLQNDSLLRTRVGDNVAVSTQPSPITIFGAQSNGNLVETDTQAGKAVVHTIDQVLLPSAATLASFEPTVVLVGK